MARNFTGRSARDHTISINMRRMRQMEVNMNDSRSDTNMTITVGTGRPWNEIYEEVRFNNRVAKLMGLLQNSVCSFSHILC